MKFPLAFPSRRIAGRTLATAVLLALASSAWPAEAPADVAFAAVRTLVAGQGAASKAAVMKTVCQTANDPKEKRDLACQLAGLVAEPNLGLEHRNFIGQMLAIVGDAEVVPALSKLLADSFAADAARGALEAIPGEAASVALREVVDKLEGKALAGVLNSIGARHDAAALPSVAPLVKSADTTVARAALHALGQIGTTDAAAQLQQAQASLPAALRPAGFDARLVCAARLAASGRTADAAGIFKRLNDPAHPSSIRLGALRGLARTAPEQALPALLEAMRADAPDLAGGAVALTASLSGSDTTKTLAAQLGQLRPPTAAWLIQALGERRDPAGRCAVLKLLDSADETVKLAATGALAFLGDVSTVERVVQLAAASAGNAQQAAQRSLERLSGAGINQRLGELAGQGEPAQRIVALKALADRRQPDAKAVLFKCAGDRDAAIRVAALNALTQMAGPEDCPALVGALVRASSEQETMAARKALEAAGRELDAACRLAPLTDAMKSASGAGKLGLLQAIGSVGGGAALELVKSAFKESDPAVRATALRVLADWPDESAAQELFQLARSAQEPAERERAARGYFRLAESARNNQAQLLRQGAELTGTPAMKRLWLGALGNTPSTTALDLAVGAIDDAAVRGEAALAALKIGEAVVKENPDVVKSAMERVAKASIPAETVQAAKALARRADAPVDTLSPVPYDARVIDTRVKALRENSGNDKLLCYVDCGVQAAGGADDGPGIAQVTGQPWWYGSADDAALATFASVAFHPRQVTFALKGLDPKKKYAAGFSWWDYDGNGRAQSFEVKNSAGQTRRLLNQQLLPKYAQEQRPPMEYRAVLSATDYTDGKATLNFLHAAGPNAVVSELWLSEVSADAPPGISSRPAAETKPKAAKAPPNLDPPAEGIKVLIVTGNDYPGHPWRETAPALQALLEKDPRLKARIVEDPEALASPKLKQWDVVIIHFMDWEVPGPGPEARENLKRFVSGGNGMALTHFACGAWDNNEWPEFRNLAGRVWDPKLRGHDPHGTFRVDTADPDHPITRGLQSFETLDELYTCLTGDAPIHVVAKATSKVDRKDYPMAFVLHYGQGRVFHCVLGHDARAYASPGVGELLRRGIAWAAGKSPTPDR